MATTFQDQFWVMDPYAPPPPGTLLTVQYYNVTDNNDNGLINRFANDSIDGKDIRASYPGDTVTVQLSDGTQITVTGVTFYLQGNIQVFTPIDGTVLQDATFVSSSWVYGQGSVTPAQMAPVCFTPGTRIRTPRGEVPVERLKAGDLVLTLDRGAQEVLAVHVSDLDAAHLRQRPRHGPVRIGAGAMGQGLPERDLTVSPQHRVMISSPVARRMFDSRQILAPACQLAGRPGIARIDAPGGVRYIHLLLDHHAIVLAEGLPCETLFIGAQLHEMIAPRELMQMRRALEARGAPEMAPARPMVRGRRLRQLLRRHEANAKPLLDAPPQFAGAEAPETAGAGAEAQPRLRLVAG